MSEPQPFEFRIATMNVENLAGPGVPYYEFQAWRTDQYREKIDWIAREIHELDADILVLQEVWQASVLSELLQRVIWNGLGGDARDQLFEIAKGKLGRDARPFEAMDEIDVDDHLIVVLPPSRSGRDLELRVAIVVRRLGKRKDEDAVFRVLGEADGHPPRFHRDFESVVQVIADQAIGRPLDAFSRTVPEVTVEMGFAGRKTRQRVVVFGAHLKSKRPELPAYSLDTQAEEPLEATIRERVVGPMISLVLRAAEAVALRRIVLDSRSATGNLPTFVCGDLNDDVDAVTTQILEGETMRLSTKSPSPSKRFRTPNPAKGADPAGPVPVEWRYTQAEQDAAFEKFDAQVFRSAAKRFAEKTRRDIVYTYSFGGDYTTIDHVLYSRELDGGAGSIGELRYVHLVNDHVSDKAVDFTGLPTPARGATDHGFFAAKFVLTGLTTADP